MTETTVTGAGTARLSCLAVEQAICAIWSDFFGRPVGPYDDFYDLGGDSVAIFDVVDAAQQQHLPVRSSDALRHPTPARLAEHLTVGTGPVTGPDIPALRGGTAPAAPGDPIVAALPGAGPGTPLWVVHSDSHAGLEWAAVAGWSLGSPIQAFRPGAGVPGGRTVAEIAAYYLRAVRREQPSDPYRLAGFGSGAMLALEMARQLRDAGTPATRLALIGPTGPGPDGPVDRSALLDERLRHLAARFGLTGAEDAAEIYRLMRADGWYDDEARPGDLAGLQSAWTGLTAILRTHPVPAYDGPVLLVDGGSEPPTPGTGWPALLRDARVHHFGHGVESPRAVLGDPRLAPLVRAALG
jgi:thioesterase domain-containing protein